MTRKKTANRHAWEHFRFAVIGPLLVSPPEPGTLQAELRQLASKVWAHPIDPNREYKVSLSTLNRWYYRACDAHNPVEQLKRKRRTDADATRRVSDVLAAALERQYRQHSHWSVQLHYDNLNALANQDKRLQPMPSYSTMYRFMQNQGWHKRSRPKRDTVGAIQAQQRLETREVRSFEVEYVNALWHLDFHHGSMKVLTHAGEWLTPKLLSIIDDRSRLVCHMQWYLDETTQSLVHGFSQALLKRGLPRALMSDNGSAMTSDEFTQGLASLSILHQPTLPYSPYQNAKQETLWTSVEGRLMAMLTGVPELTLAQLNEYTQAWVEKDYHRKTHREIGASPLQCFINGNNVGRPTSTAEQIKKAFCKTVKRRQRLSDGTVALESKRFEIPNAYRHFKEVYLRYASWDLSHLTLVEPNTGEPLSAIYPIDKHRNADGLRRQLTEPTISEPPQSTPPLLQQLVDEQEGLPSAYIASDDEQR